MRRVYFVDESTGYLKDGIGSIMFIFAIAIVYMSPDLNKIRNYILIALVSGFTVDGLFTFYPDFHSQRIGQNVPTYLLGAGGLGIFYAMISLVFPQFSIKKLLM